MGLLLCGAGCLLCKLLGYFSPRNPWIYFWLGFFVVSTLSMLGSLIVPINIISLIIFFIIGTAGLPFFCREYKQSITIYDSVEKKIFNNIALLAFIVIVYLSAFTVWPGRAIDTDFYHAQIIRWYNEYGTPPGLGNLQTQLAFNSSWLSLAALFDNGIWDNRSAWIMPGLMFAGGILYFLHELIFIRQNGIRLFAFCILVWLFLKVITGAAIPSLYYDTPVHILNAVVVLEVYYLFSDYTRNLSKKEIHTAASILMLGASAFMIKPIGMVSLLFSGILTMFLLVRNQKQTVSSWFIIFTPALCGFIVWVTKNIFLSGYLLYPLPIFAMPFDWVMPFTLVENNYIDIPAWARMPGYGYRQSLENGFWFWFKPWIIDKLKSKSFMGLVIFPSCFSFLLWFLVIRYEKTKKHLYFFIWTLFSIFYWFVTAPAQRFGDGFFWVFPGAAFLFLVPDGFKFTLSDLLKNPKIRIVFIYFWGLCTICVLGHAMLSSERNLLTVGTIPSLPVKECTVNADSPFTVWIPDDDNDDRTGNSPLPSAPNRPSNLEMREPGNLGKGFRPARY